MRQAEAQRRQTVLLDAGHLADGAGVSIGQKPRIIAEPGIGAKCIAAHLGFGQAEGAGRARLDAVRGQQLAHLGELARIVSRDHQLASDSTVHVLFSLRVYAAERASPRAIPRASPSHDTAIFCKSTSRATPLRANAIKARNSSCEKGVFSAVPCTSMMRPSPVITKLA